MPYKLTPEQIERSLFPQLERRGRYLGHCYNMSREDVQDIINGSLVKLIESCPRVDAGANIEAYAETILHNKFRDMARQKTTRRTSTFSETNNETGFENIPSEESDFSHDEREGLATLINALDRSCSEILHLNIQGYTYKQIAARLRLTLGTVMSKINRCKNKLIHLANEEGFH